MRATARDRRSDARESTVRTTKQPPRPRRRYLLSSPPRPPASGLPWLRGGPPLRPPADGGQTATTIARERPPGRSGRRARRRSPRPDACARSGSRSPSDVCGAASLARGRVADRREQPASTPTAPAIVAITVRRDAQVLISLPTASALVILAAGCPWPSAACVGLPGGDRLSRADSRTAAETATTIARERPPGRSGRRARRRSPRPDACAPTAAIARSDAREKSTVEDDRATASAEASAIPVILAASPARQWPSGFAAGRPCARQPHGGQTATTIARERPPGRRVAARRRSPRPDACAPAARDRRSDARRIDRVGRPRQPPRPRRRLSYPRRLARPPWPSLASRRAAPAPASRTARQTATTIARERPPGRSGRRARRRSPRPDACAPAARDPAEATLASRPYLAPPAHAPARERSSLFGKFAGGF